MNAARRSHTLPKWQVRSPVNAAVKCEKQWNFPAAAGKIKGK
jgi:hypothetical protein